MKTKKDKLKALENFKSLNLAVDDPEEVEEEIIKGALNDKED